MAPKSFTVAVLAVCLSGLAPLAGAQHDPMHDHMHDEKMAGAAGPGDLRMAVRFPSELREHTLANMRDHLLSLEEIQEALSRGEFDRAAKVAEFRLGMSSLSAHGAHEVAKYMPQGMQDAGTSMHRSASRFAIALQEAAITGDLRKPLGELAKVTASCVACHAGYRLE